MNKLNLTSEEWCDLVFSHKNKKYGGYLLRIESGRRLTKATVFVVSGIVAALAAVLISGNLKRDVPVVRTVEVTAFSALPTMEKLNKPQATAPKEKAPVASVSVRKSVRGGTGGAGTGKSTTESAQGTSDNSGPVATPVLKSTIQFTTPVIREDADVLEGEEMKTQRQLNAAKMNISIADVKGSDEHIGADIADVSDLKTVVSAISLERDASGGGGTGTDDGEVFTSTEEMPVFPGGEARLRDFIRDNFQYPAVALENGVEGRVVVSFVVSPTGRIEEVKVVRSLDEDCDEEAVRLVKSMPPWSPGKQGGRAVRVRFIVPIIFKIEEAMN